MLESSNSGLEPELSRHGYRFVKRVFDLSLSSVALTVGLVPSLVLCAVIYAKSPGASPIYSQYRVGRLKKDGSYKVFKMYKFRSMRPGADAMLESLRDANEADGPLFKIKDDPRVIPGVGTFIRKHSIDELGQMLNVWLGDFPLRILKMRPDFSMKNWGAFALPANEVRTNSAVSSQVSGIISAVLRALNSSIDYCSAVRDDRRSFFAKAIVEAVCV